MITEAPTLRIYDKDFNFLAIVDAYTSLQAERKLWEIGALELHISLLSQGASELNVGNIIMIDEFRVYEITGIKKTQSKDLALVVTGHEFKGVLKQRIVVPGKISDTQYFGWDRYPEVNASDAPAESIMKHYVSTHAVNTAEAYRALPGLTVAQDMQRGITTRWSERFKPLDQVLKDIGEFTGIGYNVSIDVKKKQFIFDIIPEIQQTTGSETPVVFSIEFDNVNSIAYEASTADYSTVAYAGGAGVDEDRLIQQVARTPEDMSLSGYARRESWLDIGSAQNVDELEFEAKHQLSKIEKTETATARVAQSESFEYMKDWDIGSIVTVQSKALGIRFNKKITAVKEVYERGKIELDVTFGKRAKDIRDQIYKTEVVQ